MLLSTFTNAFNKASHRRIATQHVTIVRNMCNEVSNAMSPQQCTHKTYQRKKKVLARYQSQNWLLKFFGLQNRFIHKL